MSTRRTLLALAALATLLLAPAATHAAGPAAGPDPALVTPPRHAYAVFKGGTVKGIAALLWTSGQDGRLEVALHGISRNANHRLVASRQPCGTAHDPSSGALSWKAIDGGKVSRFWAHRDVAGLLPFIEAQPVLSFRLFRTTSPKGQLACATAVRLYDQSQIASPTAYELENVLVSSFRGTLAITSANGVGFSLHFEEVKGFSGDRRIVGSSQPCSAPNTGGSTLFSYRYRGTGGGSLRRNLAIPQGTSDPLAIRSVRLFKGSSGFGQPAGCSGIIAILIGL